MIRRYKSPLFFQKTLLSAVTLASFYGSPAYPASSLEEIVVTATKRETSLQDTAMSITAFSELELQRSGAEGIFDYGTRIPNLGFSNEADGRFNAGSPAIRGVAGGGVVGATGFYIDDIPVPEYLNPKVKYIERIEVLRGPQGTLYGARSMGGTVRLITKKADTQRQDGYVTAGLSDVSEGDINSTLHGGINVPLVEGKLGLRALAYYAKNSGVFDRVQPTGSNRPAFSRQENVDDDEYYGFSLALAYQATENLTINPRFMYQKTDSDNLPLADLDPGNFTVLRHNNITEQGEEEWWLGSVTLTLDTEIGQIVSTTATYDREVEEFEDQTGTLDGLLFAASGLAEPHIPSQISETEVDEAIVHETRLISDYGDWLGENIAATLGLFYEVRKHSQLYPPSFGVGINEAFTNALNDAFNLGIPLPPGALGTDQVFFTDNESETTELALYGEVTFKLNDSMRLTLGARWSDTEVDSVAVSDGFVNNGPASFDLKQSESSINPKVLLEADVSDDILVYGSASKGFRIGGNNFNLPFDFCAMDLAILNLTSREEIETWDSDSVWNYELGIKSVFADNRIRFNASAFFIDWSDIIQTNRLSCGFQFVANAGDAESKGFEVEVEAAATENLTLSLGLGITDARITEGDNPISGLSEGDRINQVPKQTFNAGVKYSFGLPGGWEGYLRGDYSYYGDSLSANNNATAPRVRDSFELVNLRLGAYNAEDWEVALFAKNLTNEHANLSDNRSIAAEKPGRPRLVTNRPRTIGLEVRRNF